MAKNKIKNHFKHIQDKLATFRAAPSAQKPQKTACSRSESNTASPTTYFRNAVLCTVPLYRPLAQLAYNVVSLPTKLSSLLGI